MSNLLQSGTLTETVKIRSKVLNKSPSGARSERLSWMKSFAGRRPFDPVE